MKNKLDLNILKDSLKGINKHSKTCSCIKYLLYNIYRINIHPLKKHFQLLKDFKLPEDLMYTGKPNKYYRKLKLNDFTLKDFISYMYLTNKVFIVYHMYDGIQICNLLNEHNNRGDNYVKADFKGTITSITYYIGKQLRRLDSWLDTQDCIYCKKTIDFYKEHYSSDNIGNKKYEDKLLNMKLGDFVKLIENIDLPLGIMFYDDNLIYKYINIPNKWLDHVDIVNEFIKNIND